MKRVLILEDNDDLRVLLRLALERDGHRVEEVDRGGDLVRRAAAFAPDVVLVDLRMPAINGEEAVARLRADERTARVPVVIVSADARTGEIAARLGVPYVRKPFALGDVRAAVRAATAATATTPAGARDPYEGSGA